MTTRLEIISAVLSNPGSLVEAADKVGLPLHIAAAFAERESKGKNVYGHDAGGAMYGVAPVTEQNYALFYDMVVVKHHRSNGVGPMQITYPGYFPQAAAKGVRLWIPRENFEFGFRIIAASLHGDYSGASIARAGTLYNSGSWNGTPTAYGIGVRDGAARWKVRLAAATPVVPTYISYTVRAGDTLSSIAKKFGTTWTRLYDLNRSRIGSNPNVIRIGLVLRVPKR